MLPHSCRVLLLLLLVSGCAQQQDGASGRSAAVAAVQESSPAEVTEAGAKALEAELRRSLDRLNIALLHQSNIEEISVTGLEVRPQGDAYALSTTGLEFHTNFLLPLGFIVDRADFLLEPLGPGLYRMTLLSDINRPRVKD